MCPNFCPFSPDDQDKEEERLKRLAGVNLQSEHVHQIEAKKKKKADETTVEVSDNPLHEGDDDGDMENPMHEGNQDDDEEEL